uniref:Fibroblast growth factor n=1 Tax=Amazona collaria TaxID=241587 RepID=A0A8B9F8A3_9PSIT
MGVLALGVLPAAPNLLPLRGAGAVLCSCCLSSPAPPARGGSRFPRSRPGRRRGRLYCRVGIGFHLQLHPDGRVDGAHDASPLSECTAGEHRPGGGIVGIRGVFSNKFLAMSKKGKLHASVTDCQFRERFQENSYNTYASAVHRSPHSGRQWYVALNKRGKAKRGCSPRYSLLSSNSYHLLSFTRHCQSREKGFYFIARVVM